MVKSGQHGQVVKMLWSSALKVDGFPYIWSIIIDKLLKIKQDHMSPHHSISVWQNVLPQITPEVPQIMNFGQIFFTRPRQTIFLHCDSAFLH